MDSLERFSLFVQVAEAGGFVKAAQQLGISASAVGKSIARLEDRLGVSLFRRTTRSMSLTEEGEVFLERCRNILCEIEMLEMEFSTRSEAPRGKLRITLPLVNDLFLPMLSGFSRNYPEIELDLDFTDRIIDLVEEGYDVAIRTGRLSDSQLITKRIGSFKLILVATPDYLARHGVPIRPADLKGHTCLRHKFPHTGKLEEWPIQTPANENVDSAMAILCNNIEALLHFVRMGHGIACISDFAVNGDIREGRLQQVLNEFTHHEGTFQAIWAKSRYDSPRIRAFVEYLGANNPLKTT